MPLGVPLLKVMKFSQCLVVLDDSGRLRPQFSLFPAIAVPIFHSIIVPFASEQRLWDNWVFFSCLIPLLSFWCILTICPSDASLLPTLLFQQNLQYFRDEKTEKNTSGPVVYFLKIIPPCLMQRTSCANASSTRATPRTQPTEDWRS